MSRMHWLMALASLMVTVASADHASAFCRMTTASDVQVEGEACNDDEGEPLEWSQACISYAIDERGSQWMNFEDVEEAIDLAFEEWENVDCGGGSPPSVVFQPLQPSTCRRHEYNCSGNVNTIAFLSDSDAAGNFIEPCGDRFPFNAFAVTIVWHNESTGEIFDADMLINDTLAVPNRDNVPTAGGPYASCPDDGCPPSAGVNPGAADLRSIVTHEIGHIIGIGHSDVADATMFATNERRAVNKRDLHPDDEAAICTIYPPGSLEQSCDATPRGGLELDCEEKACTDGPCQMASNGNGCSALGGPASAPWGGVLAACFGLMALRRRRRHVAARS